MPLPQNINAIIGAGVFGIVCAATLYVVEHYRQERRRHAMSKDLARIHTELAVLRRELDTLLTQQKQKVTQRRAKRDKKDLASFLSSTTTEDYSSAVDGESSDLEFYDVSDDEPDATSNADMDLEHIDQTLEDGNSENVDACLQQLQNLCLEFPENPQLLWRLGKAHFKLYEKTEDRNHITKGIDACSTALNHKPELANAHKWMAILIGERTKFQPIKERILDGYKFKEHVDAAVRLNPLDASLHHMLGRFAYDVADLKWYERKVAAALFAEPPTSTHEEALAHFLEAEKLSKDEWKENMLYIAKCKIKLGLIQEAVSVLERADAAKTDNGVDDKISLEIKELLGQHKR